VWKCSSYCFGTNATPQNRHIYIGGDSGETGILSSETGILRFTKTHICARASSAFIVEELDAEICFAHILDDMSLAFKKYKKVKKIIGGMHKG
jgi:hypothetical protein